MVKRSHEWKVICDWLPGLILLAAVILVYLPVWHAGFIWDDDDHITANPCIVGPLGFKEIWTTRYADICPLTRSTFWVEHALWGLNPLLYHLVNVLMHGACGIVLWRVLRSLQIPGAWLGAALWALHPVQVESVAWITETKNTQSGLFCLLSILFFIKGLKAKQADHRSRDGWTYASTLLFAALAMASKSSTVVLPVVLCLCAWWMEGRWHWRTLDRVAPIFPMSIAASALSIWTQKLHMAPITDPQWMRTWPERLAAAGDAVWFYLGKLLWPHPLMTIYPRWQPDVRQWTTYLPSLAVIVVLFIFWLKRASGARPYFFAWAYFLVALLPIVGLVDNPIFIYSLVFDHLQYLASMGPLVLAGAGLARWADFALPGKWRLQSILCAVLLLISGIASWQRVWVYRSDETLWTDAVAKNPNCWVGYSILGNYLLKMNQPDEAIVQYQKSLAINPKFVGAHNNFGNALFQKGSVDEAIARYRKALEISPYDADLNYNLGVALVRKGRVDDAIAIYQKILEINPRDIFARYHRANAYLSKGDYAQALADYNQTIRLNPQYAAAYNNLAWLFATCPQAAFRNGQKAVEYATKSCQLSEWKDPHAMDTLAAACAEAGDFNNALKWENKYLQAPDLDAKDTTDAQSRLALYQAHQPYHAGK